MRRTLAATLLILLASALLAVFTPKLPEAQTHTFPALDTNNAFTGNETHSGTETFSGPVGIGGGTFSVPTGNLAVGGGQPWYDVTASPWNAKCDGVTDDTAAFNAAIAAAAAPFGGFVYVPARSVVAQTCIIASAIDAHQTNNVLLGSFVPAGLSLVVAPIISFTGNPAAGRLVDARSTVNFRIQGLQLVYNNAAFNGRVIDFQHSNSADSQGGGVKDSVVAGTSTSAGATCLICVDQSDDIVVDHVSFQWAVNAMSGPTSNRVRVTNSLFNNSITSTTISNAAFVNMGNGWLADSNNFELGSGMTIVDCTNCNTSNAGSMEFSGNWIGDCSAACAQTLFKNIGLGGSAQTVLNLHGNYIGGGTGAAATMLTTANGPSMGAVSVTGNIIANFSKVFGLGTSQSEWHVMGNHYAGTITTFMTGSPGNGMITDNTGATNLWFAGTAANPSLAFIGEKTGYYHQGTNTWGWVANGVNQWLDLANLRRVVSTDVLAWSSGDPTAVVGDTALSRVSAGVLGVGVNETSGNVGGTLQAATLQISGLLKNIANMATMGLTLKKGSGAGNYTNATTSYTVADSANLCFTVTIPTGWKLGISASGALATATAAVVAQAALTDNAACSTANAGILVETAPVQGAGIGVADAFALNWVITGDGAAHNIALQFKTSNVADTASLINSSATVVPTIKFELLPSN